MKTVIFLLASYIILLASPPMGITGEEEGEGKITGISGQVELYRDDEERWEDAGENALLHSGDMIRTSPDAWAEILLHDNIFIKVEADTEFEINPLQDEEDDIISVSLILGKILTKIELSGAKPIKFEVHTATAVAGVRGTYFHMATAEDGATRIGVEEGQLDIEAEGEVLSIKKGEETTVEFGHAPKKVVKFLKDRVNWEEWRKRRIKKIMEDPSVHLDRLVKRLKKQFDSLTVLIKKQEKRFARLRKMEEGLSRLKEEGKFKQYEEHLGNFREELRKFFIDAKLTRRLRAQVKSQLKLIKNLKKRIVEDIHSSPHMRKIVKKEWLKIRGMHKGIREIKRKMRIGLKDTVEWLKRVRKEHRIQKLKIDD